MIEFEDPNARLGRNSTFINSMQNKNNNMLFSDGMQAMQADQNNIYAITHRRMHTNLIDRNNKQLSSVRDR